METLHCGEGDGHPKNHQHLQFVHTQGMFQNDHHNKWYTYLSQFHLNIKYKNGSTNRVANCLCHPPVATLTILLKYYGNKNFGWPQIYKNYLELATT